MKNQENEKYIEVRKDWERDDIIGVDVVVAWCSSISRRVRVFLKKQYADADGKFPVWYVRGKLNYACEMLPRGWFVESGVELF